MYNTRMHVLWVCARAGLMLLALLLPVQIRLRACVRVFVWRSIFRDSYRAFASVVPSAPPSPLHASSTQATTASTLQRYSCARDDARLPAPAQDQRTGASARYSSAPAPPLCVLAPPAYARACIFAPIHGYACAFAPRTSWCTHVYMRARTCRWDRERSPVHLLLLLQLHTKRSKQID